MKSKPFKKMSKQEYLSGSKAKNKYAEKAVTKLLNDIINNFFLIPTMALIEESRVAFKKHQIREADNARNKS